MYNIRYKTKHLQRCYEDAAYSQRKLGKKLARQYVKRINVLKAIDSLGDLRNYQSLRFHPLTGRLKGKYAIDLDERKRLWFTEVGDEVSVLRIEKIDKDHYGH